MLYHLFDVKKQNERIVICGFFVAPDKFTYGFLQQ